MGRGSETQLQVGENLNSLIQRFKGSGRQLFLYYLIIVEQTVVSFSWTYNIVIIPEDY